MRFTAKRLHEGVDVYVRTYPLQMIFSEPMHALRESSPINSCRIHDYSCTSEPQRVKLGAVRMIQFESVMI